MSSSLKFISAAKSIRSHKWVNSSSASPDNDDDQDDDDDDDVESIPMMFMILGIPAGAGYLVSYKSFGRCSVFDVQMVFAFENFCKSTESSFLLCR